MNLKKTSSYAIGILLFLSISSLSIVQSNTIYPGENQPDRQGERLVASLTKDSITLHQIHALLEDRLHELQINAKVKLFLLCAIENGIGELNSRGISSNENLLTLENSVVDAAQRPKLRLPHLFLMNIHPDVVNISTVIPPSIINLSEENTSENSSRTMEVFIKFMPFKDYVKTEQRLFIPTLYQSTSRFWPSIGCRIIEQNTTIFIIAFGLRMQHNWKLF